MLSLCALVWGGGQSERDLMDTLVPAALTRSIFASMLTLALQGAAGSPAPPFPHTSVCVIMRVRICV
jgi:hypothetical protein